MVCTVNGVVKALQVIDPTASHSKASFPTHWLDQKDDSGELNGKWC